MFLSEAILDFYGVNITILILFIAGLVVNNSNNVIFRLYEGSGEKCIIHELALKRPLVMPLREIKKKMGKIRTRVYNCNDREESVNVK